MTFSRRSTIIADRQRMTRFWISAAAATLAALPATAQNTQAPTVITVPQRPFDLQPNNPQATPTPSPTAAPAPPPVISTLPSATPAARASPTLARRAPPVVQAPAATPTPVPVPTADVPTPEPTVAPIATPTPTPASDGGVGAWPWLLAALVLAALAYLGWRRWTAPSEPDVETVAAEPVPTPQPSPPAAMRAAPPPAAVAGLAIDFTPTSFRTQGPDAYIAFELTIANPTDRRVEAIRTLVALSTAGPDIAGQVAAFNASAGLSPGSTPFDLAPGASERLAGELLLAGDAMYVTEVGERALIVPVALINLRWREGLSLRSRGESWMIGAGAAGAAKLGPLRVDRGSQVHTRLAARRFEVPAA